MKRRINATTVEKSHVFGCVDPKPKIVRRRLHDVLASDKPMFETTDPSDDLDTILARGRKKPKNRAQEKHLCIGKRRRCYWFDYFSHFNNCCY